MTQNTHLKKSKKTENLASHGVRYYIGNLLIVISLTLLFLIYFPFLKLYLPIPQTQAEDSNYYIQIPKINAKAPIVEDVDPFNETEYRKALEKGVAKAKGFPNFYFAHSSDAPWRITRYNTVFFRLGELQKNDQIIIKKNGEGFRYSVIEVKEVWPNEVEKVTKVNPETLILQTCTPIGTSLKRLLVFANPV